MKFKRKSGIILHPTSLPGEYGIGSLGQAAYKFIDFLKETGQRLWQVCPLGPTGFGDSPYQSFSAFAGNPNLISLEVLKEEGLIGEDDLGLEEDFNSNYVEYGKVINFKFSILRKAFAKFNSGSFDKEKIKFTAFCQDNIEWLEDYTLYAALKENFNGKPWNQWPDDIKFRTDDAMDYYKEELKDEINFQKFIQYLFFKQWSGIKEYANENGIKIIGDLPIFVAFDSSDAWAHSEIFLFDEDKNPTEVAGVPPDCFSETGQLWGNPLYDWDKLKERSYDWWIYRFNSILELVDIIRIDHFRGFDACWHVKYGEDTAINGEWVDVPGKDLFSTVKDKLGKLPIIIEDLGVITEGVEELRDCFQFPGMKVLQFAFDSGPNNKYLPHNYSENFVVYTGTHDNDTTLGWYLNSPTEEKEYIQEYLDIEPSNICWGMIEAAWSSVAIFALAPLQDIMELGSEGRMNTPGAPSGNWQWRYTDEMLANQKMKDKLRDLTIKYRTVDDLTRVISN